MFKIGNTELLTLDEINNENDLFDYSKFFYNYNYDRDDFGAVGVISSNQFITMRNIDFGKGPHGKSWTNILIYLNNQLHDELLLARNINTFCAAKSNSLPNIYIRILNEVERMILFEIPNKISSKHYDMLIKYFEKYGNQINSISDVDIGVSWNGEMILVSSVEEIKKIASQAVDYNYNVKDDDYIINDVTMSKTK